jgi:hypothetical protein
MITALFPAESILSLKIFGNMYLLAVTANWSGLAHKVNLLNHSETYLSFVSTKVTLQIASDMDTSFAFIALTPNSPNSNPF